jgi:hypothetical protein
MTAEGNQSVWCLARGWLRWMGPFDSGRPAAQRKNQAQRLVTRASRNRQVSTMIGAAQEAEVLRVAELTPATRR